MIPDDRMELLMRLSPIVPRDVEELLRDLGWLTLTGHSDWHRYHHATNSIASMGIRLRTNETGSKLFIDSGSWQTAQARANDYYALMYPSEENPNA